MYALFGYNGAPGSVSEACSNLGWSLMISDHAAKILLCVYLWSKNPMPFRAEFNLHLSSD